MRILGKGSDEIKLDTPKSLIFETGSCKLRSMGEPVGRRDAIFSALRTICPNDGDLITRSQLEAFTVNGTPERIMDIATGIWNPVWADSTLSVLSVPRDKNKSRYAAIYDDVVTPGGFIRYAYQAGTMQGRNRKLRLAAVTQLPLIVFKTVAPGVFMPYFPAIVVGDFPEQRCVEIAAFSEARDVFHGTQVTEFEKRYAQVVVEKRLHQDQFRGAVMLAYRERCAVCSLNHARLLDAAHITPDADEDGIAAVSNGLSLCKIHHAAFDGNFMGISPDYKVHINRRLLNEVDGPMLKHGLQEMHGRTLEVPRARANKPDPDRLAVKFSGFLAS